MPSEQCAHVNCDEPGVHRRLDIVEDVERVYCGFHDPLEDERLAGLFADPEEVQA